MNRTLAFDSILTFHRFDTAARADLKLSHSMSIDPSRKKRVHAGHRVLPTRIIRQIEDLLGVDTLDMEKLLQLKLTLTE